MKLKPCRPTGSTNSSQKSLKFQPEIPGQPGLVAQARNTMLSYSCLGCYPSLYILVQNFVAPISGRSQMLLRRTRARLGKMGNSLSKRMLYHRDNGRSNFQYYATFCTFLLVQVVLIWLSYLMGQYHGVSAASRRSSLLADGKEKFLDGTFEAPFEPMF